MAQNPDDSYEKYLGQVISNLQALELLTRIAVAKHKGEDSAVPVLFTLQPGTALPTVR